MGNFEEECFNHPIMKKIFAVLNLLILSQDLDVGRAN